MNKSYMILGLVLGVLMIGAVTATVAYFHTSDVTLTVTEARSSEDVAFSFNCLSGTTDTKNVVIYNAASVPLNVALDWTELTNTNGTDIGVVIYTNNLPLNATLIPVDNTVIPVTFTCDAITDAGTVTGTIGYSKIK